MAWIQSDFNYIPPEPYIPCEWSTGTDAEIVEALEKHYAGEVDLTEYWAVGDERTVSLSAMSATGVGESHVAQDVVLVLSDIGGKYLEDGVTECVFQVDQKNCLNETGYMNATNTNSGGWKSSARRTWCNSVYKNAFPSTLVGIFKEFINQSSSGGDFSGKVINTSDIFALRAEIEILGSAYGSISGEGSQVKWYETAANRIKNRYNASTYQTQANAWWTRSAHKTQSSIFCDIEDSGSSSGPYASGSYGIAPFGVI